MEVAAVSVVYDPPTLRRLFLLAWPIIISRSTQTVVGVVDALMVAPLGEAALAATTTGALNTFNILVLPMGTVFIVQSFAAQLFGKGDPAGARRYGMCGLVVALVTEVVCVAGAIGAGPLLTYSSYSPEVQATMTDYLIWRLPSGGAAIGIEALANYYGGLGNTRLPMLASVLAMVLNVVGNWLLIGGNLGAPQMGVTGAALASSLATGVAFLALLACFWWGVGAPKAVGSSVPGRRELWRTVRFGLPSGFNWFFEFLAFSFFVNVVVGGLGTTSLAAMMAVMQVNSVSFMPAFALGSGGAILVGQAIGAKRLEDVGTAVRLTFLVTCAWQGGVGILYALIPGVLLAPFAPAGAVDSFLAVAVGVLVVSAAWQLFDAAAMTFGEVLRAAGDTQFAMFARLAVAWLVFVPGVLVSARVFGVSVVGATVWVVVYLGLLSLVLALRYRSGVWRKIDLVGGSEAMGSVSP